MRHTVEPLRWNSFLSPGRFAGFAEITVRLNAKRNRRKVTVWPAFRNIGSGQREPDGGAMTDPGSAEAFHAALTAIGQGIPNAAEFQRLTTVTLHHPMAAALAAMDPFSAEYRAAALALYLELRADSRDGYVAERDEASAMPAPAEAWLGATPWSFQDSALVAEHLLSWAHILQLLEVSAGASVLEYGPGSGQLLLMLARMGMRACGVDIDPAVGRLITHQAAAMGLDVPVAQAVFGEGFAGDSFDRILFFEAFHHAFDFAALLRRLHHRLKPGGRIILCGEPIVPAAVPSVPFPWGPRLDALSVFCIQRYGWMELGFTHDFFVEAARRAGWTAVLHPFPGCGRARAYVLSRPAEAAAGVAPQPLPPPQSAEAAEVERLGRELAAVYASTSWRLSKPLRVAKRLLRGRAAYPGGKKL